MASFYIIMFLVPAAILALAVVLASKSRWGGDG